MLRFQWLIFTMFRFIRLNYYPSSRTFFLSPPPPPPGKGGGGEGGGGGGGVGGNSRVSRVGKSDFDSGNLNNGFSLSQRVQRT